MQCRMRAMVMMMCARMYWRGRRANRRLVGKEVSHLRAGRQSEAGQCIAVGDHAGTLPRMRGVIARERSHLFPFPFFYLSSRIVRTELHMRDTLVTRRREGKRGWGTRIINGCDRKTGNCLISSSLPIRYVLKYPGQACPLSWWPFPLWTETKRWDTQEEGKKRKREKKRLVAVPRSHHRHVV